MPPCRAYALSAATYKKLLYPRKKIRLTTGQAYFSLSKNYADRKSTRLNSSH